MPELPKPYEILELKDGEFVAFRVLRVERGSTTIFPDHQPQGKVVDVLRVHVPPDDKPTFPHYWDILGARLNAQLSAELDRPDLPRLRFTVKAQGLQAKKYYSVLREVL